MNTAVVPGQARNAGIRPWPFLEWRSGLAPQSFARVCPCEKRREGAEAASRLGQAHQRRGKDPPAWRYEPPRQLWCLVSSIRQDHLLCAARSPGRPSRGPDILGPGPSTAASRPVGPPPITRQPSVSVRAFITGPPGHFGEEPVALIPALSAPRAPALGWH
jgi:hypothetical protein